MERRKLHLDDATHVAAELDRLRRVGYQSTGNWTLGQICQHLSAYLKGSLDGFDCAFGWATRCCAGRVVLTRMLTQHKHPSGLKCPQALLPGPADQCPDAIEIENYLDLFQRRFPFHTGAFHPSPTLGELDKDQWLAYHLIHAEHHLACLMPATEMAITTQGLVRAMVPPSNYVIRTPAMA